MPSKTHWVMTRKVHRNCRSPTRKVRNHHEEPHGGIGVLARKGFHELRHPEEHREGRDRCQEIDGSQMPNSSIHQRLSHRDSEGGQLLPFFTRQVSRDPISFLVCQKFCFRRSTGKQEIGESTPTMAGTPSRISSHLQLPTPNQWT